MTERIGNLIIDRTYDVPYLAGYNTKGTIIYYDRKVPTSFPLDKGKPVYVVPFIVMHETVEQHIEDALGIKYQESHAIATEAERKAVELAGYNWDEYQRHWKIWIERCSQDFSYVPPDLDLEPYVDSKDFRILEKIRDLREKGRIYV